MFMLNNKLLDIDYIKDNTPVIYSTSEIKTNKNWIDGKPIYRKVIEYEWNTTIGNASGVTNISIPHNVTNYGDTTQVIGVIQRTFTLPVFSSGGKLSGITKVDSSNINFRIINDTWGANSMYVILEYTKTTD